MNRDDCYRILDLPHGASQAEIRDAWRKLNKVWHPDRFGDDEGLRRKAEEKLKEINQAYEMLRKNGHGRAESRRRDDRREKGDEQPAGWTVRDDRHEVRPKDFQQLARWILQGKVVASDEVWDPRQSRWMKVSEIPELARLARIRTLQKWTRFALFAGLLGFVLLIRRPVGLNAVIGLSLLGFAFVMMWLYRQGTK